MKRREQTTSGVRDRGNVAYRARAEKGDLVSATEAAKTFGTLLDRVRSLGVEVVIERHGTPVARLIPASDPHVCTTRQLVELLRMLPPIEDEYRSAVRSGIDEMNQPVPTDRSWDS